MNYQQGSQRIEIIVRKDSGSAMNGAKETESDKASNDSSRNEELFGTAKEQRIRRIVVTNAAHGAAVARQVGFSTLQYMVGGIGNKYGDQALQEQTQRQLEIVQDVSGFATSVTMGAVYGKWGGPVGMVLGAVFGAISSAASLGFKYEGREREFNYKVFKENNAIEYQRARASINMTTGRLR